MLNTVSEEFLNKQTKIKIKKITHHGPDICFLQIASWIRFWTVTLLQSYKNA